jgi:ribosomal protein L11
MTKKQRANLHAAINSLTLDEVAGIVREQFPKAKSSRIDALAKQIVSGAHREVSPRTLPRMQRG